MTNRIWVAIALIIVFMAAIGVSSPVHRVQPQVNLSEVFK